MDRYIDIRLRPDPEFTQLLLMSALFAKLHRGLVQLGSGGVGVSFPGVESETVVGLGDRLRLHGTQEELTLLMSLQWLTGLSDFLAVGGIDSIPDNVRHRIVQRVQAKSSPERLRRRRMKRKGVDAETAKVALPDNIAEKLDLPFVSLTSQSTGQRFRLFIHHGPLQETATSGQFTSYGFSQGATIPWF